MGQTTDIHNLWEEIFNLTNGFEDLGPWPASSKAETLWQEAKPKNICLMAVRKQKGEEPGKEEKVRDRIYPLRHAPCDLFLPSEHHLLIWSFSYKFINWLIH